MKWRFKQGAVSIRLMKGLLLLELILSLLMVRYVWQLRDARQHAQKQFLAQQEQWRVVQQNLSDLAKLPAVTLAFDAKGSITGLQLTSAQTLDDWKALLTSLQQQFWLVPSRLSWHRDQQYWLADISLQFLRPATLKPEHNWLPVSVEQKGAITGTLMTTLQGERPAALIRVAQKERWLHEGGWHPSLHATVIQIKADYVVLQDVQGKLYQLFMQEEPALKVVAQEAH